METSADSSHPLDSSALFNPLSYNEQNDLYWWQVVDVLLHFDHLGFLQSVTATNLSGETKTFQIPQEILDFRQWSWKKISNDKTSIGQKPLQLKLNFSE